jgi:hypothetical protein
MMVLRFCITVVAFVFIPLAHADWDLRGQGNLLLSQTVYSADDSAAISTGGVRTFNDIYANARLMARNHWGRYDVDIHYQLGGLSGDSLAIPSSPLGSSIGLPSDSARLFNLTQVFSNSGSGIWGQRLDRFNIGYAGEHLVWRLGRQAVSWGNGLVFQPLDIFNPFSPLAIDTSYKTGDDLLYAQWLFSSGNDLQAIYLPRRDPITGALSADKDSTALKYHAQTALGGWDLLLARHYDEDIVALGHVQDVGGAVWRIDINHTRLTDGRDAVFAITNMDYSWTWFNHNFYGFIEYYFNSLGQDSIDITTMDTALGERLQRGEVFSLGRNEIASGLMMELSPRWQLNGTFITNLHDRSSILVASGAYDWKENTKLQLGAQLGSGSRNSEYGGLYDISSGGYLGLGTRFYVYIQQYY